MNTLEQLTENMLTGGTGTPAPQGPQGREELSQFRDELLGKMKFLVPELYSLAVNAAGTDKNVGLEGLRDLNDLVDRLTKFTESVRDAGKGPVA